MVRHRMRNRNSDIFSFPNRNSNIKHYIDELTKHRTVAEIMDALFNDYITNIVDKAYHRLLTSDNVSNFRPEITEGLKWKALDAIITLQPDLIALPNATFESILKIDRMILYSDQLPLVQKHGELQPIDFKDVIFYVPAEMEAPFMQQNIHDLCVENGFSPKEEVVASWQTAMANVYNGKGVVVADSWTPTVAQPYFKKVYFKQKHEVFFGYRSANTDKRIPVLK